MVSNTAKEVFIQGITRDGKTFLGGDQVQSADLGPKITEKIENKTDKRVYFRGDIRANYGKVMEAIDGIRAAGVSQLGMIAEKPLI